jgi:hypothetical protein
MDEKEFHVPRNILNIIAEQRNLAHQKAGKSYWIHYGNLTSDKDVLDQITAYCRKIMLATVKLAIEKDRDKLPYYEHLLAEGFRTMETSLTGYKPEKGLFATYLIGNLKLKINNWSPRFLHVTRNMSEAIEIYIYAIRVKA